MDRRKNQIKQRKNKLKNALDRSDNKMYRLLVGFMIFAIVNWFVWYNQYLNTGIWYKITFVCVPTVLGMVFFYFKFKTYFDYYLSAPTIFDRIGCWILMFLLSVMLSFSSFGTFSDIIFKSVMNYAIKDQATETKSYKIKSFVFGSGGRSINRFSRIEYDGQNDKYNGLSLDKFNSNDSKIIYELKSLEKEVLTQKKLILYTKEGFWGIKKIIKYKIE